MPLTTYNDIVVPSFMYGTAWKKETTAKCVEMAVEAGFTAIDTANQLRHYNEALVGEALLSLQNRGIKRESLFIQTKFTSVDGQGNTTRYDAKANLTTQVKQSMDSSLQHLHTDCVDSYVLHGPYSRIGLGAADWEVWTAIEDLYTQGKTRMIGVSNVTAEQLSQLCLKARVKPMMVQNRCYAIVGWDREVRDICNKHNIIYQGFSLLTANGQYINDRIVQDIARRLGTGVAPVIFSFAMHLGMLPLTGTTDMEHMRLDLTALDLKLTEDDVRNIESIAVPMQYA
ncbi:MAG: aldo/keto reductase [Candidatus Obscuribacter sp.]|nr:aldo/keto reductase [Candidatus Obscuribacter sp.]